MRKIVVGFLMMVVIAGLTTATGYAAFAASADVQNISFSTGNAELLVSNGGAYGPSTDLSSIAITNGYPGSTSTGNLWFKNTGDVPLKLSAQLVSATDDWGTLSPVAEVSLNSINGPLANWNTSPVDINITVPVGAEVGPYPVVLSIPSSADNSIANKTVTTQWVVTGAQVL